MNITTLFKERNLSDSLLIGFYGGGNYGDELLMEVLSNLFFKHGCQDVRITYQTPATFKAFHHNFGFTLVPMFSKLALLKAIMKSKNILIGGGGLWGLDVNNNIFILSCLLFFSRWVLRKNVYLIGVGYYSSTTRLGHISAWLAGKAATAIIARDPETQRNFNPINRQVSLDSDIAWYIKEIDLAPYVPDVKTIEKSVQITGKTLFITLRRFRPEHKNKYTDVVAEILAANTDKPIVAAILEPKHVDPEGYNLLESWQKTYKNVQIVDFSFNPLALFLFFQKHRKDLLLISPQFHALITAHLNNAAFLPLVYDNKSAELLTQIGYTKQIHIREVNAAQIQTFIKASF